MSIDIWEGGRRLRLVGVALIALFGVASLLFGGTSSPYIHLASNDPSAPFRFVEKCGSTFDTEYIGDQDFRDEVATVELCLGADDEGRVLYAPVPEKPGFFLTDQSETQEVRAYIEKRKADFKVGLDEARVARQIVSERRSRMWGNLFDTAFITLACIGVFWATTWAFGWIIQGFKPKKTTSH